MPLTVACLISALFTAFSAQYRHFHKFGYIHPRSRQLCYGAGSGTLTAVLSGGTLMIRGVIRGQSQLGRVKKEMVSLTYSVM